MARVVFIVQGEGRGHMSQAMAMEEILVKRGDQVVAVFLGGAEGKEAPIYFREQFKNRLFRFRSPALQPSPNRKGIALGKSIWINLLLIPGYLQEIRNLRKEIANLKPGMVFNFYDGIGALALQGINKGITRIGVGHHFFLHLDRYRCQEGSQIHRWLLYWHTRIILRSCDRVLALSFRKVESKGRIRVIPPLIRAGIRNLDYRPGNRYLVYLLHEGYLYDLLRVAKENPTFQAEVFTGTQPEIELPKTLHLHPPGLRSFMERLSRCRGLITTAGFDTLAEAAYLGIPILAVPAQHHFEQRCNGADLERSGLGRTLEKILPGLEEKFIPFDPEGFRAWAEGAEGCVLEFLEEA